MIGAFFRNLVFRGSLKFVSGATTIIKQRSEFIWGSSNSNYVHLSWISGLEYGKTYDVQVKSEVGAVWSEYGQTCQITINPLPGPKLTTEYCGKTLVGMNNYLYVEKVFGATDYIYHVTGNGVDATINRSSIIWGAGTKTYMHLKWIPGLQIGKTYNVEVKSKQGLVESAYGQTCQFTISNPAKSLKYRNDIASSEIIISDVSAFPNPFTNNINIKVKSNFDDNCILKVYNITGQILLEKNIVSNSNIEVGDEFSPGIYIVSVLNNNSYKTIKIIKN